MPTDPTTPSVSRPSAELVARWRGHAARGAGETPIAVLAVPADEMLALCDLAESLVRERDVAVFAWNRLHRQLCDLADAGCSRHQPPEGQWQRVAELLDESRVPALDRERTDLWVTVQGLQARGAALERWAGAWKDSAKSHRRQERAWNASEWDMLKRVQQKQARVAALEQIASERATRLSNQDDANQTLRERVAALEGLLDALDVYGEPPHQPGCSGEYAPALEKCGVVNLRGVLAALAATREAPTPGEGES